MSSIESIEREFPNNPRRKNRWIILWRNEQGHGFASKYQAVDELGAYKCWLKDQTKEQTS